MSKATTGVLIVLASLVLLPGCGKEGGDTKAPAASSPPAAQPAAAHPTPTQGYAVVDTSGITKAAGGKTVAEVYAEKDQLVGKQVIIRGKVVKANANIMGKNWLHVRDGTGSEDKIDLTVTTTDALPSIGQTVIVTGQLSGKKDLGLGYQYDVLIEDAKVKVE